MLLRHVAYVIEAHFPLTDDAADRNTEAASSHRLQ